MLLGPGSYNANTQKQSLASFTVDCARESLRQILLTGAHSLWWRCAWSSLRTLPIAIFFLRRQNMTVAAAPLWDSSGCKSNSTAKKRHSVCHRLQKYCSDSSGCNTSSKNKHLLWYSLAILQEATEILLRQFWLQFQLCILRCKFKLLLNLRQTFSASLRQPTKKSTAISHALLRWLSLPGVRFLFQTSQIHKNARIHARTISQSLRPAFRSVQLWAATISSIPESTIFSAFKPYLQLLPASPGWNHSASKCLSKSIGPHDQQ